MCSCWWIGGGGLAGGELGEFGGKAAAGERFFEEMGRSAGNMGEVVDILSAVLFDLG